MTRPLKFRAWLGEERGMSNPFSLFDIEDGFVAPNNDWNKSFDLEGDIVIIMQFTGLYDANGREVYEGDVVRLNDGTLATVEWDVFRYIYRLLSNPKVSIVAVVSATVVGNIYEGKDERLDSN
jgi:hypothetical protein